MVTAAGVLERAKIGTQRRYPGSQGGKDANCARKNSWQKGSGKKGGKGQNKSSKRTLCSVVSEEKQQKTYIDEDRSETIEEPLDNDDELQRWCLLEESKNERKQKVISRRDKQKVKKANHASLLSVENNQNSSLMKFIRVKDR